MLEGPWARRVLTARSLPGPVAPDRARVEQIAAALDGAQRPLVVAGGGTRRATDQVRTLADLGLPVLTTVNGKGVLDERHPSCLGAGIRLAAAHQVVDDDVLLVVGAAELGDSDLWGGVVEPGRPGERIVIRVDLDPAQMHKNVAADLPVVGDAARC